ncbi:hypothetical protein [Zunongwangia sp.]|uniref:hypothetical protein n=1 Tax=Zunongwangia sp. TaxID=1965325 RepID=UPI003AA9310E
MRVFKCFFIILFLGVIAIPNITAFINYHATDVDTIKILGANEEEQGTEKLYAKSTFSIPDKVLFNLSFLAYSFSKSQDLQCLYLNRYQSVYANLSSPPPELV